MLLSKVVMVLVTHLATPQLAEKLKSLSLRIGKPGAPPNPPSDTLFLSDLIFQVATIEFEETEPDPSADGKGTVSGDANHLGNIQHVDRE